MLVRESLRDMSGGEGGGEGGEGVDSVADGGTGLRGTRLPGIVFFGFSCGVFTSLGGKGAADWFTFLIASRACL